MEKNKSFAELFEETTQNVKLEKTITGKIITITDKGEIFVDLGYKADGIIPKNEYSFNENDNPKDEFKNGDIITVDILKMNDGQGNVLLSYKNARKREIRKEFENKVKEDCIFEEKIKSVSEKGAIVVYKNCIHIFIPMSLLNISKNENKENCVGKTIKFKIIEYDPSNRKIIGSVKKIVEEEKRKQQEKIWSSIEVGKTYTGTIKNIENYGMFIDIGMIQGLLHKSEVSWNKRFNLNSKFNIGDKINVTIKDFNKEENRLQFSYPEKEENPWKHIEEKYHVNYIITCKVVSLTSFGAFVELEEGIEGLVHISQITEARIAKPEEVLKIGQKVNAKIIDIHPEQEKIELSIKELEGTSNEYIEEI